jgi:hypothetical protein
MLVDLMGGIVDLVLLMLLYELVQWVLVGLVVFIIVEIALMFDGFGLEDIYYEDREDSKWQD